MTKHVKIALNPTRDIPFDALVLSQANVRRVKAGVSIDTLAADIARRGLLQSLTVRPQRDADGKETGLYEVPAGGRRFRALQSLVKAKRMRRDAAVPCIVRDDAAISAEEDSLAENVHREALHPLDQFRAMQTLVEQGSEIETIAATFMVTPAVVRQRMKLASVSPKLHALYAEDAMTLEQLIAFSVSEDHARQEQVWDSLPSGYSRQPHVIRAKLLEQAVHASDKRVRLVGLNAYVAAGGYVLRDLFEPDDGGWLQDVGLLAMLVDAKLAATAEDVTREGWKWVETRVDLPYGFAHGLRELTGTAPVLDEAEQAQLDALHQEADALELQWAEADHVPDEVEARITQIDEAVAELVTRPLVYDPVEVERAGAFIAIERDGSLRIERGFVRPEDEPVIEPQIDEAASGAGSVADGEVTRGAGDVEPELADEPLDEAEDASRPLPERLMTELTSFRTLALRDAVAASPDTAFIALLHALVVGRFYRYGVAVSCVELRLQDVYLGCVPGLADSVPAQSIDARHAGWEAILPDRADELWPALVALGRERQVELLAHCVSYGVNAVWEPANRYNDGRVSPQAVSGRITHSQVVAAAASLDLVAAGWTPSIENYLGRVTKAQILAAVEQGCGEAQAERLSGLKKPDMAKAAEAALAGTGWLPELLREPTPETASLPDLADTSDMEPAFAIAAE